MRTLAFTVVLLFATVVPADEEEALKLYEQGHAKLSAGEFHEAADLFNQALVQDPKSFLAEHGLGGACAALKRHDEAIRHFRAAVRLKPDFAQAHNSLGEILARKGELEQAEREFRSAVRHDEKNARGWYLLGLVSSRQRDWQSAARAFGRASKLRPQSAGAAMNHGIALLGLFEGTGQRRYLVDAIASLSRARSLDPEMEDVPGLLKTAKEKLAVLKGD